LSLSTLADQVGACCAVLTPLIRRLEAHVFAAERLHGDDTTVPVLAKGKKSHQIPPNKRCRASNLDGGPCGRVALTPEGIAAVEKRLGRRPIVLWRSTRPLLTDASSPPSLPK
jgi:Transposase IS66 family